MALLDDLKKQAQEKSLQQAQGDSITLQKHDRNWHVLAPKIYLIFNYLKELAEHLNVVSPEECSDYSLTKAIIFRNLTKQEFRIVKGKDKLLRSFDFRYDLVGEKDIQVVINNLSEAEKIRHLLSEKTIRFVDTVENKNKIVFQVKPRICVQFSYAADLENCMVILNIKNFDGVWDQTIRYSPDVITESLMDETAKYILLQPNKFMELSGNTVSDDIRNKLREKLKRDGKIAGDKAPENKLEGTASKVFGIFRK